MLEDDDTRHNTLVGQFLIEGLADVHAGNQIVVRLDLDLDGILKVTATERATGLARQVTIDNATERRMRDYYEEIYGLEPDLLKVRPRDVGVADPFEAVSCSA